MADLASLIYGTAQNVAQNQGAGFVEAAKSGAALAQQAELMKAKRAELEQKQQEIQMAKLEKIGSWYEAASKMEDGGAKRAFLSNFIPNGIESLGMSDAIHPTTMKMFESDPLIVDYMSNEIRTGRKNYSAVLKLLADPAEAATVFASPEYKQFGAAQEIAPALQESIGKLRKASEFAASEEGKALRAQLASQAPAVRQEKTFSQQERQLAARQLTEITGKINNPSSRSGMGQNKNLVNAADSVATMVNGIGVPEGQMPPPNETRAQRVARLNKADSRQVEEVIRNLDTLLSARGSPTVSGQEHLRPVTLEGITQKYGEKLFGTPRGAQQGEFLIKMLDTAERERNLAAQRIETETSRMLKGYPLVHKIYPNEIKQIATGVTKKLPAVSGASEAATPSATVQFNGKSVSRDALRAYLQAHPNNPDAAAVRAALGE